MEEELDENKNCSVKFTIYPITINIFDLFEPHLYLVDAVEADCNDM